MINLTRRPKGGGKLKNSIHKVLVLTVLYTASLVAGGLSYITLPNSVFSEANFFYDADTVLHSDGIVLNFSERVIDLVKGDRLADISDIDSSYSSITSAFNSLDSDYGIEYIIKQVPDAMWGDTTAIHKISGTTISQRNSSQLFMIRFINPIPVDSTTNALASISEIEFAHQAVMLVMFEDPNDTHYLDASANPQWYFDSLDISEAWDLTHGSSNIEIAIIDTGACEEYDDIDGKFVSHDGKSGEHGAAVASVAAGETNNGFGISGIGWNTALRSYNVDNSPISNPSTFVHKIHVAQRTAEVLNFSLGTVRWATRLDISEICPAQYQDHWSFEKVMPENYPEIENEVLNALDRGVVVVAAAGNGPVSAHAQGQADCDLTYPPADVYPAMYEGVIAVSGTELFLGNERFKEGGAGYNYGNFITVAAPAVDIWASGNHPLEDRNCTRTTQHSQHTGTSFAAPMVAGLASLLLHYEPDSSVKEIIKRSADKIAISQHAYDSNGYNNWLGYGRINAYAALLSCHPKTPSGFTVSGGNDDNPYLSWNLNAESDIDGYKIYRKFGTGAWGGVANVSENTNNWSDSEVTMSSGKFDPLVYYRITAYDLQDHESQPTASVSKRYDELIKAIPGDDPEQSVAITELNLTSVYPNPFNSSIQISFQVPQHDGAQLHILDVMGRKVKSYPDANVNLSYGNYSILWDGSFEDGGPAPSGVYYIMLSGNIQSKVKKVLLLK